MIVVDASALVEVLLHGPKAESVARILFAAGQTMHAPHLIDIEVAHVLRRYAMRGDIASGRSVTALSDLTSLRLKRYPHKVFLPRIWELRNNLSAYDAVYVSLAEVLDAPLITCDRRLAGAAGHDALIEVM
jgi:predicted nucleic acid-binding protein